jgi:hypothetical protein
LWDAISFLDQTQLFHPSKGHRILQAS